MRRTICLAIAGWMFLAPPAAADGPFTALLGSSDEAPKTRDGNVPLARGVFLVARHQVSGYFAETVLLILDYGAAGTSGVILNRPTTTKLERLLAGDQDLGGRTDVVYRGGPVSPMSLTVLIRAALPPDDSSPVVADIHASGEASTLRASIVAGATSGEVRAYFGYAGWMPGQLAAEVERGDWRVVPAAPDRVFAEKTNGMWEELSLRFDGTRVRAPLGDPAV